MGQKTFIILHYIFYSLLAFVILAVSSNMIKTHHIQYNGGHNKTVHGESVTAAPANP